MLLIEDFTDVKLLLSVHYIRSWDFIWKILSKSYVELVSHLLRYPQASLSFLVSLLYSLCFSFVELIIAFLRASVPFKHFACIIWFVTVLLWFDCSESWFSVC